MREFHPPRRILLGPGPSDADPRVLSAAAALEVLRGRKGKVQSWYLDLSMVEKYWGGDRTYHHTAPISMNFALREALRLIEEEGLENVGRGTVAITWHLSPE